MAHIKECKKNVERNARDKKTAEIPPVQFDDETAKAELEELRRMMIKDCNIAEAVKKLNITRHFRKGLMENKETDVRQKFPFFLTNPKLVRIL